MSLEANKELLLQVLSAQDHLGTNEFLQQLDLARTQLSLPVTSQPSSFSEFLKSFQVLQVQNKAPKVKRLYVDGCFDLMHSGHFNALRQCKSLCETLVCGVVGDKEMVAAKGPNIMSCEERCALARSCKWVDEVVPDVVYTPTLQTMEQVNCSHLAHGDDIAIGADGKDAYLEMRQLDKLLIVKRTEGISTTDIVGRLLLMSKEHLYNNESDIEKRERKLSGEHGIPASQINEKNLKSTEDKPRMQHKNVKLYNTTKRIRQFCSNREAKPTDKVVYVCGSFDLLHKGHCEFLEKAAKLGTFLVLGLYDDETVNQYKGSNFPVLNYQERTLNMLAMKYVDEVIIGAPWKISEHMIKSFNISVVAVGDKEKCYQNNIGDRFEVAKNLGILQIIHCEFVMRSEDLIDRIVKNRQQYIENQKVKEEKLKNYYLENQEKTQIVHEI